MDVAETIAYGPWVWPFNRPVDCGVSMSPSSFDPTPHERINRTEVTEPSDKDPRSFSQLQSHIVNPAPSDAHCWTSSRWSSYWRRISSSRVTPSLQSCSTEFWCQSPTLGPSLSQASTHLSMRIPRQVPPAAPNGQFEIRMEAMIQDQPVGRAAGPEGLHDLQHVNIAYDMIGHHPQPLRVSNFHLPGIGPPF